MSQSNLFYLLGITDPGHYTREGVEQAWFALTLAAKNSESTIHQVQQFAYQYLTGSDPAAEKLLQYLLVEPDLATEPHNLVLHRTLIALAAFAQPFTVPDAKIGSLLTEHAGATGIEVYRHEADPYLYALGFPEGIRPDSSFVPAHQAGIPLKDGQPRYAMPEQNGSQAHGPLSVLDHLREFLIDLFLFRWLRTNRVGAKFAKVLLLVTIIGLVWYGVELFAVRSHVWTVRGYATDIVVTTDNAAQHLRDVRKWFREVELLGTQEFGFTNWWKAKPPSEFSLTLLRNDPAKKEEFLTIRAEAAHINKRINALTAEVDSAAKHSSKSKSKDLVYQSQRTVDEIESLLRDLETLTEKLEQYIVLY